MTLYSICRSFQLKTDDIVKDLVENAPELNYVYTIKEFQVCAGDFPDENYKFIGASIMPRAGGVKIDFSEIKNPVIYISLGTLMNKSASFYIKCMKAFENEDVTVIMSIGNAINIDSLGRIPDNFKVCPFVPQLEVLQHTALFITHGGMNSVNEAMYYGVPMLAVPVGNDQPTVAKRIAELELGKYIDRKGLSGDSMKKAAFSILQDSRYKNNMETFQKIMASAGGNDLAARQIASYIMHVTQRTSRGNTV